MQYRLRTLLIVFASSLPLLSLSQDKADHSEQLIGEWDIIAMTYKGRFITVEGTGIRPLGRMNFENGTWTWTTPGLNDTVSMSRSYRIVRPGEIDFIGEGAESTSKALYELKGDGLRILWRQDRERPADFDALKNTQLTLYELQKVK
jgi:uncharacterized protein (TIGR03067 family)